MCLAVLVLQPEAQWTWIVVANRDETHARPSADMQPWQTNPAILGGRDLRAGGSWLGVRTDGRFALLTNYREPGRHRPGAASRGQIVEDYLQDDKPANQYLAALQARASIYNGFNVLVSHGERWWHASNRADPWSIGPIAPGVYGLSNALFNTAWPKVVRTRQAITALIERDIADPDEYSLVFRDARPAADENLPSTGLTLERERMLSSPFILSPEYGTRCTTVVMRNRDGRLLAQETTFEPDGSQRAKSRWLSRAANPWERLL